MSHDIVLGLLVFQHWHPQAAKVTQARFKQTLVMPGAGEMVGIGTTTIATRSINRAHLLLNNS